MCTQYGACSNLPIITVGDVTGILAVMGLEYVAGCVTKAKN